MSGGRGVLLPARGGSAAACTGEREVAFEGRDFLLLPSKGIQRFLQLRGQLVEGRIGDVGHLSQNLFVFLEPLDRVERRDRLDAPDAGGEALVREDLEGANLARAVHVAAAAELRREA